MGIVSWAWDAFFVNTRDKRKKYSANSILFRDRHIKTLAYMALSQLRAECLAKSSRKKNGFEHVSSLSCDSIFQSIDKADIVSFDIFDTLLFRPVARPVDMFWFLELDNQIFDFKKLRVIAELQARKKASSNNGEVSLRDIYLQFDKLHTCSVDEMVRAEEELEEKLCFCNPFAYRLYEYAKKAGKKIIATSDMYLSSDELRRMLLKYGMDIDEIYVSCEVGMTKRSSSLQKNISQKYSGKTILHIGDDSVSDIKASKAAGWQTVKLDNVNHRGHLCRAYLDDSFEGSVYSGIINAELYNGCFTERSTQYMYGFVYGGLLTLGFCQWLNELYSRTNSDHILFLGRDCSVIKQVYDSLYPDSGNSYVEISRFALLPLLADISFENYLLEGFERRLNSNYTFEAIFKAVGLGPLMNEILGDAFSESDHLSRGNYESFCDLMYGKRELICDHYKDSYLIFKEYISSKIGENINVIIVDVGWRGSTIRFLNEFFKANGGLVSVTGAMFGLCDSDSSYVSETSGLIQNYLFSSSDRHDSTIGGKEISFNASRFMFEYMYTSTDNSVIGYSKENGAIEPIRENKDITLNNDYVRDVHAGIMDFVNLFKERTEDYLKKIHISSNLSYLLISSFAEKNSKDEVFPGFNEDKSTVHGY
ncbi:MAG: HAD-IA family hydrolase [Lachnospiraceae bacterium]|nr:HAD-IA family hydrolase [Lachnospiraceae bacterium]